MRRAAALVVMAASLLAPAAAGAHTHLSGLRPEPEAVLARPPDAVRLTFNQPVDVIARGTGIRNAAVDLLRRAGGRQLVLRPRSALRAGRVEVRFRVLSKDGHVLRGRYGFTVRRSSAPAGSGRLEVRAEDGAGLVVAHGAHHALLVLALGLALAGPLVLSAAGIAFPTGVLRGVCAAGVLASLLMVAVLPGTTADTVDTDAGTGWLVRAGLWLAAALVASRPLLGGAALAGVAVSLALSGHAGTHGGATSVTVDAVHVLAAGVWLGGLAVLAWARAVPAARAAYARVALLAFAALAASGALNAVLRVGSVDALTDRAYGRLVAAKVAVAAAIAAVAAIAALRRRRVALELGLGTAALALAAVLVETTPPS